MSRLPFIGTVIAVATFSVLMASQPIGAQWASQHVSGYALRAPKIRGAVPVKEEGLIRVPNCPSMPFRYSVTYPRGIDNGGPVDRAAAAVGRRLLAEAREQGSIFKANMEEGSCVSDDGHFTAVSSPFMISGSIFPVLFSYTYYSGGNHAPDNYIAMNLMSDGSSITPGRIFPNMSRSLPLLRDRITRLCVAGIGPQKYDYRDCSGNTMDKVMADLGKNSGNLDNAAHMILTSLGLSMHFESGFLSSYASGPQFLDISKDDLLRIGADPAIWR
jgi:hypothetical protein